MPVWKMVRTCILVYVCVCVHACVCMCVFVTFIELCNKGCGMCYPVYGMVHIKEPFAANRKV